MLENIFDCAGTVYQPFVLPGEMVNQHYYQKFFVTSERATLPKLLNDCGSMPG